MNIVGFIEEYYPIRDRVRAKLEDPYTRVATMDDLPYDVIGPDESGHITKLVEIDDDRSISVVDLISMTKEDVENEKDPALMNVWENYMSQIDLQDLNVIDIMEAVKQHRIILKQRKEKLDVLSL